MDTQDYTKGTAYDGLIDNDVLLHYMSQGRGTGPVSRALSAAAFLAMALLAIQLFKDGRYIPLVIFALLVRNLNHLVVPGLVIYCVVTQYWTGLICSLVYAAIPWISCFFGFRSIRRHLENGIPMIGAFEGAHDLRMCIFLECVFLALALLTSSWVSQAAWILFGVLVLYHAGRCYVRLFPKWRRIHQPMMYRYAGVAAAEHVESVSEDRAFDSLEATELLLQTVYDRDLDLAHELALAAKEKQSTFADKDLIAHELRRRWGGRMDPARVDQALESFRDYLKTEDGAKAIVQFAIAEVVEQVYGTCERAAYLVAVIRGDAK